MLKTTELFKQELSHQRQLHHITEEESVRLREILLEMLADIQKVCREHQIPYMAGGGTVLGAVRHRGFIPWDDDIDLNVAREYIPRLLAVVREEYGDKYLVVEPVRSEGYLSSFIQIQRRGTVMREYLHQKAEECGIKIDIFVIENTYDSKLLRTIHGLGTDAGLFFLSCYRMFAWRREFLSLTERNPRARMIIRMKSLLGIPYAIAPRAFYTWLQRWMKMCRNTKSRYITIPSGRGHFFGELYERSRYCNTVEMPFENMQISVTKDYDSYMTRLYGDYRKLPPEDKREKHVLYELHF